MATRREKRKKNLVAIEISFGGLMSAAAVGNSQLEEVFLTKTGKFFDFRNQVFSTTKYCWARLQNN